MMSDVLSRSLFPAVLPISHFCRVMTNERCRHQFLMLFKCNTIISNRFHNFMPMWKNFYDENLSLTDVEY
jgi:hypothetical protein